MLAAEGGEGDAPAGGTAAPVDAEVRSEEGLEGVGLEGRAEVSAALDASLFPVAGEVEPAETALESVVCAELEGVGAEAAAAAPGAALRALGVVAAASLCIAVSSP